MSMLATQTLQLPAMSEDEIAKVRCLERMVSELPQINLETHHLLHGGMYHRTIFVPAGAVVVGALIKLSTTLTISGHATVFVGEQTREVCGYQVIPGGKGRKQAVLAHADSYFTMSFPTQADSVEQAEIEFTDEYEMLMSRYQPEHNTVVITGEA